MHLRGTQLIKILPAHVTTEKFPSVPHTAFAASPVYPVLQTTATVAPVVPVILPAVALSELATSEGVHSSAYMDKIHKKNIYT